MNIHKLIFLNSTIIIKWVKEHSGIEGNEIQGKIMTILFNRKPDQQQNPTYTKKI